jgi:acetylglutamate kinase
MSSVKTPYGRSKSYPTPEDEVEVAVIKISGNIIDDEVKLAAFLEKFAKIHGRKIMVHGGGKLATKMAEQLNIPQQMIDGRRITDAETLRIVTMVYAGYINKNIVAQLHKHKCNAFGLSGADGDAVWANKREKGAIDYGFAGDVEAVNRDLFITLLNAGLTPVVAPITHDGEGQLLNTNADTIAQELARTLSYGYDGYKVTLVYGFEKKGVLLNVEDENSVLPVLTAAHYEQLKEEKKIFAGMIPKLDNAFAAIDSGVKKVIIGQAEELPALLSGDSGTTIIHE